MREFKRDLPSFNERVANTVKRRNFWILSAMLVVLAWMHYLTPQARWLPIATHPLGRHAVERIIFILPIAGATFAFGQAGGLIVLVLSVAIMLPRVFFISPYPADAAAETFAVTVVGALVVWMIETQEKEKHLRQEAVRRMQVLNAVIAIASESLEMDQILTDILEKILEVSHFEAGCVYLRDKEMEEFSLAIQRGFSAECADEIIRFGLGERLLVRLQHRQGTALVLGDIQEDVIAESPLGGQGFRSLIVVPLLVRGAIRGVMVFVDSRPNFFVRYDIHLLTAIGQQVSVAIDNAQLHQDVARQLRVQQRLNEVAEQITSELELERILPKVLSIAKELVGADGGFIALLDREGRSLTYPYLDNLPSDLTTVTVSSQEGLAGSVVSCGQPLIVANYPEYENAIPEFAQAGVKSTVAVPILSGEELFGTLGLVSLHQIHRFSEREVVTLCTVGRQAGIAIKNAQLYENFRFYVQQITQAQEEERKRIARELHDDTVQDLIALSRRLDALPSLHSRTPEEVAQRLEELQRMTRDMIQSVRRFSRDLRPSILDHLGLLPALESLVGDMAEEGVETVFNVFGERRRLPPQAELILFRIVQEALSNARRHAEATRISVALVFSRQAIQITVEDNGRGFTPPALTGDWAASGRLGLIGMAERTRLLEGTLELQSEPGHGTRIFVEVPV